MNQASEYRYWGFISYSSQDTATAVKLLQALENFRIPKDLIGRLSRDGVRVPLTLTPIFHQREEIPLSVDLGSAVQDALRASRYLIVICSPDAARSQWVNEEIRFFCSLGRSDRILPIIIRGEPNVSDDPSPDESECFPPALRYRIGPDGNLTEEKANVHGWDLRQGRDGWSACLLKAVGGMTGIGLTPLLKRRHRRKRRNRTLAAAVMALALGVMACWWDYARTKVSYYAQLTERFGIPRGAVLLDSKTLAHRNFAYRVESKRLKVRRIVCVNSANWPVVGQDELGPVKAAIRQINYRDDGTVDGIDLLSPEGHLRARTKYSTHQSPEGTVIFVEIQTERGSEPQSWTNETAEATQQDPGWDNSVQAVWYGKDGLPARRLYLNADRAPRANPDGLFGEAYQFDENRLLAGIVNLGPGGEPTCGQDGVITVRLHRGILGEVTRRGYFGKHETPVPGPGGWHQTERALDPAGNLQEERFLDASGALVPDAEGYAIARYEIDWHGNVREKAFFDAKGQPALNKHLTARETISYDELGRVKGKAYFGVNGEPVLCSHGVCRYEDELDSAGTCVQRKYLDGEGHSVPKPEAIAQSTPLEAPAPPAPPATQFQSQTTDQPAPANSAMPDMVTLATAPGNATESTPSEAPAPPAPPATQFQSQTPDQPAPANSAMPDMVTLATAPGNATESTPLEAPAPPAPPATQYQSQTPDQPAPANSAMPEMVTLATALGNAAATEPPSPPATTPEQAPDRSTQPEAVAMAAAPGNTSGNDSTRAEPDSGQALPGVSPVSPAGKPKNWGILLQKAFSSSLDAPVLDRAGNAEFERGNRTGKIRLDSDGEPILLKEGIAKCSPKFDEDGNLAEVAFWGSADQRALHKDGYWGWSSKFDERGHETLRAFFGLNDQLTFHKDGYAGWTAKFDEQGHEVERTYLGADGQPIHDLNGVARWTRSYGPGGHEIKRAFFHADGSPAVNREGIAGWTSKYDEQGRLVEAICFGVDNQPVLHKHGYAGWTVQFDSKDNEIKRVFFGLKEKPVLIATGCAGWASLFDDQGNEVQRTHLGLDGQPAADAREVVRWTKEYNEQGYETKCTFSTANGKTMMIKEGIAGWTSQVDRLGNQTEAACFGVDGQPALHRDGYAKWTAKFDARGHEIERAYFGTDGKPVLHRFGMHRRVAAFDAWGREIESARFGIDGEPVVNTNHYHRVRTKFDECGLKVEQSWFGLTDEPVVNTDPQYGAARFAWAYDLQGRIVEKSRFGPDGKLMNGPDGWAREVSNYDPATGKLQESKRFDADGLELP